VIVIVAGSMRVGPAQREQFLAATTAVAAATRSEPGNVEYRFSSVPDDPSLFMVFEEWESEEALDAHFATPHMLEFLAALPTLGISDGAVHRYEVTAKTPMS
jgi:quinol monooxygenase YgiN